MRLKLLSFIALLAIAARSFAGVTAFVGVNVLPMDEERFLTGQTVIVRDGRIESIGAIAATAIPDDAAVIYGRGRWLLPGLVDMHVHVRAVDLDQYVRHGITTVRDLAGIDSVLATRARVERGEVAGPRIFVASKLLTGPNPQNPMFSAPVMRAADAATAVDAQLARGCDSIKLYDGLPRDTYMALVAVARARGVRIAGHVTQAVDIREAITMQHSIEHLSGYALGSDSTNRDLAEASRGSGVWNCPTMTVFTKYVTVNMSPAARERLLADRRALLRALHDAGARILAGTDAGYQVSAGVALHDELEELTASGLTPYEALSAATRSAGAYLGENIGTVTVGSRADLLLVESNPLDDLRTLRTAAGVMLNGRWIPLGSDRRRAVRH